APLTVENEGSLCDRTPRVCIQRPFWESDARASPGRVARYPRPTNTTGRCIRRPRRDSCQPPGADGPPVDPNLHWHLRPVAVAGPEPLPVRHPGEIEHP